MSKIKRLTKNNLDDLYSILAEEVRKGKGGYIKVSEEKKLIDAATKDEEDKVIINSTKVYTVVISEG